MNLKIITNANNKSTHEAFAFTLAEVLITLGIIGIVAALTIPALMKNYQAGQYKNAYKKAYSEASNIWQSMRLNTELIDCTSAALTDNSCVYPNFTTFKSYMKVAKDCGSAAVTECWDTSGESLNEVAKVGSGEIAPTKAGASANGFIDLSGRNWLMLRGGILDRIVMMVDTNGFQKPNRLGQDRMIFFGDTISGTGSYPGVLYKLDPVADQNSASAYCGHPPCYGTSWLYNN